MKYYVRQSKTGLVEKELEKTKLQRIYSAHLFYIIHYFFLHYFSCFINGGLQDTNSETDPVCGGRPVLIISNNFPSIKASLFIIIISNY